jgi:hypothetical protein
VGTSIGALVGAAYATHPNADALKQGLAGDFGNMHAGYHVRITFDRKFTGMCNYGRGGLESEKPNIFLPTHQNTCIEVPQGVTAR